MTLQWFMSWLHRPWKGWSTRCHLASGTGVCEFYRMRSMGLSFEWAESNGKSTSASWWSSWSGSRRNAALATTSVSSVAHGGSQASRMRRLLSSAYPVGTGSGRTGLAILSPQQSALRERLVNRFLQVHEGRTQGHCPGMQPATHLPSNLLCTSERQYLNTRINNGHITISRTGTLRGTRVEKSSSNRSRSNNRIATHHGIEVRALQTVQGW
mmetsp:Transcript_43094/g.78352  ORF Transcript_43094/g.78352 Transcript_43094/m.78352 type:complete len:212 (+) Transcript_43094:1498-2133(+)